MPRMNEIPRHRAVLDFSPNESPARTIDKLNEMIRQFDNRINALDTGLISLSEDVDNLDFSDMLATVNNKINKLKVSVSGFVPGHLHDGDTLQNDGINSNGGAFAFTTTGDVTFAQNVNIGADNTYTRWGAGNDCGISYDGTDMHINPRLVGAGNLIVDAANLELDADNQSIVFGGGNDASVYYDGTDMRFDSRLVGVGNFYFMNGHVILDTGYVDAKTYYYINGDRVISVDGTENIMLGQCGAGYSGSYGVGIGYNALGAGGVGCSGNYNFAAAAYSLYSITTGQYNVGLGYASLRTLQSGDQNTAIGYQVLFNATASFNLGIASQALYSLQAGQYNVAIGYQSQYSGTSASENVSVGASSLRQNISGIRSVAVGATCLYGCTSSYNTGVGYDVLRSGGGVGNAGLGYSVMRNISSGTYNTCMGYRNLEPQGTGSFNSAFGAQININGGVAYNGSYNTFVGAYSANRSGGVSSCIFLGCYSGYYETNSNRLYITNQQGANLATGVAAAIIYGVMSATTANQELYFHAETFIETANKTAFIIRDSAYSKCDGLVSTKTTEVQTLNAVQTTAESITLLDENTYHVEAYVVGVENGGGNRASYHIAGTFYRTGGGNATLQGAVTTLHSAESNAAWDATFTVNGNDVRVSVTGAAATTIEWVTTIHYVNMSD